MDRMLHSQEITVGAYRECDDSTGQQRPQRHVVAFTMPPSGYQRVSKGSPDKEDVIRNHPDARLIIFHWILKRQIYKSTSIIF